MKIKRYLKILLIMIMFPIALIFAQDKNYNPPPMLLNSGNINLSMNKLMGDGGLQSQFSWNLSGGGAQNTEIFYWPMDWFKSNMLYQIFNPVVLDDNGIIDENGKKQAMYAHGAALTNSGATDWAREVRRYRPPHILVDGIKVDPPYQWSVDRNLIADEKIEFEDVLNQFGIRSHVEIYAFSNQNHGDYFIWKATQKFTGEFRLPRNSSTSKDSLPDQTIKLWWPISFNFGPTKAGERAVRGGYGFEGEDDLDSWFREKSQLVNNGSRDSLYVAYYWDSKTKNTRAYPNGSTDDTGDPDRVTGFLYSTQMPGFSLLYADKSYNQKVDDPTQPYAMPHATISNDLWGRRDVGLKLTYRGDDGRGRFPLDPITAGLAVDLQKGPMRFITVGPYELTKNSSIGRYDSVTFVYAIGVGGMNWETADSIGKLWINNQITDQEKDSVIYETGKAKLTSTMDKAYWTWNKISKGDKIPTPPPTPDIEVISGPNYNTVNWSYPDGSYFNDPVTGVDDWGEWRVYRKQGALYVNDPLDQNSGARWKLIYSTSDRSQTSFVDNSVTRGVDYYYAVTAVDNGSQNTNGLNPGEKLESSRYLNASTIPVVPFKPGLNESGKVRVVPNPATVAAGKGLISGSPDKISFFNLPIKCSLSIFTETGNLVWKKEHFGTADEEWNQRTDDNQYVTSGIYILAVTNAQDENSNALDNQFVKFILVR